MRTTVYPDRQLIRLPAGMNAALTRLAARQRRRRAELVREVLLAAVTGAEDLDTTAKIQTRKSTTRSRPRPRERWRCCAESTARIVMANPPGRSDVKGPKRDSSTAAAYPRAHTARIHPHWIGGKAGYVYSVIHAGQLLVDRSRDPECDAARALASRGITGTLTLLDGKTGRPRTIIDIEKAARLCTRDESRNGLRFRRHVDPASEGSAAETGVPGREVA
jgi:hypothetical protein